jgi:hypothetical protein
MANTNNLRILIDNTDAEIGAHEDLGLHLSYSLEDPENFNEKQSSMSLGITLPATPANDRLFNSFHNPGVEDMTTDDHYGNPRRCSILTGGIEILRGVSILERATHTRTPGGYEINCYGQNGDWSIEMKDLSLWHCLSDTTHTFDVATVESSWFDFDSDEDHDFVYAPVRYRQPFGINDDTVNIYHLRPSLSIYWMIIRAFRLFGYRVSSTFLSNPNYFRKMVMPWVFGDFFDLNGSVKEGLLFKVAGPADAFTIGTAVDGGVTPAVGHNNAWSIEGSFSGYVFSYVGAGPSYHNFRLDNPNVPNGYDNFDLYEFVPGSGTMRWSYTPPAPISSFVGNNVTANFLFKLIAQTHAPGGDSTRFRIEVTHIHFSGAPTTVTLIDYDTLDLGSGGTKGSLLTQTPFSFSVSGIDKGDVLEFRLKIQSSGAPSCSVEIINSQLITTNPGAGTPIYQQIFSTFELTSLQLELGGTVNFKFYDKFKSLRFIDLLRGLVDMYNLSIQTNPIDKVVTIEPTHEYLLPVSGVTGGYFKSTRLDWTQKQDLSKEQVVNLFSDTERQLDFQFKQDGSDGGQNIYAARFRAIYLNNTITNKINNTNIDNGIQAGVPGAARYMFPMRFRKGSKQLTNNFFSATMHYNHKSWKGINGAGSPAPQLICIFPDNINDSSAGAVTQTFEPKIAYYKGPQVIAVAGGWRWIGDPAAPYSEVVATSYQLPLMFAVNYGAGGESDPVLSYCDQMINGNVAPGLLKAFFLKRLAIMRHGKQYSTWMNLDAGDMINWLHRERIIIQGGGYNLIGIEQYNPLSDSSAKCVLWKVVNPEQRDVNNTYPSAEALAGTAILSQFDIRYAPLLLFTTDIPQV